jgi:hypothetical protein
LFASPVWNVNTRPYAHGMNVFLPRKSAQTSIYDGPRRVGDSACPVLLVATPTHVYGQATMENLVAADVAAYFGVIKSEITITATAMTAMDSSEPGTIITLNMVRIYAMISACISLY